MKRPIQNLQTKALKALLTVVALLSFSTHAFAGDTSWYAFYDKISVYPTGAGKVYADVDASYSTTDANGEPFSDTTTPAEELDVKFTTNSQYGLVNAHVQTADGWNFVGFYEATLDENYDTVFKDSIASYSEKAASLSVTATVTSEDETAILGMIPELPDVYHYAIFSRVVPAVAPGQKTLGTVRCVLKDNSSQALAEGNYRAAGLCNDFGDDVTMLATPSEAMNAKFEYWENPATGEKFTDNPLTIKNIQTAAHYEAHFSCPDMKTIEFPAEGGYKYLTFDKGYQFDSAPMYDYQSYKMKSYQIGSSTWGSSILYKSSYSDNYYTLPGDYSYISPNYALLVYGKGTCTFTPYADYDEMTNVSYIGYAAEDTKVSSLTGDDENVNYIYSIKEDDINTFFTDENTTYDYSSEKYKSMKFTLLKDDDVISANSYYLQLPATELTDYELTEAPAVIYYYDPQPTDPTGISNVSVNKPGIVKGGIYTIDGKRLTKATKPGLYIINGKKVMK